MWCTNCGAEIAEGMKFCTSCGHKFENNESAPSGNADKSTFVLGASAETGVTPNVTPNAGQAPQIPVYSPWEYEENKTVKAEKGKAGYIIVLIICFIVIAVSLGLVLWTVLGDSSGSKKNSKDTEEEFDEDEDEDEDDEDSDEDADEDEDGDKTGDESIEATEATSEDEPPAAPATTVIGQGTPIQNSTDEDEEPAQEEPEEESQYMLDGSDCRKISEEELYDFGEWECRLALNELYARHGRIFDTPEIQEYFESKDWYHGTIPKDEWDSEHYETKCFNDFEVYNRDLIVKYMKDMGWR